MKHFKQDTLKSYIQARVDTYIHGPTGSSKTTSVQKVASELGLPFYKKLISSQMTESSLLGYMDAQGRYVEGIAYKPYKEGGILTLDEIDNGNPNTNTVVNGLSDNCMAFPCGMIMRHPDCVLVATANTLGGGATMAYVGRNKLDAALLNRFPFIEWPYDSVFELQLAINLSLELHKANNITVEFQQENIIKHYIDFIKLREASKELKLPLILSTRNFLQAVRLIAANRTIGEILNSVFLKGLNRELAEKLIKASNNIKYHDLARLPLYVELFQKYKVADSYITPKLAPKIEPVDTWIDDKLKPNPEYITGASLTDNIQEIQKKIMLENYQKENIAKHKAAYNPDGKLYIESTPPLGPIPADIYYDKAQSYKPTELLDSNPFAKQAKKGKKTDVTYVPAPLKEGADPANLIEQGLR